MRKIILPISFVIFLAIWAFLRLTPHYWNGKDRLNLVVVQKEEVDILVFDPQNFEITKFIIPGDTQVDVASSKGKFKIKNVWQLGADEGLGGKLLTQTVTKNFYLPVFLWRGRSKTNLPVADRISLWIFKLRVKETDINEIDLGKGLYVKPKKLEDGSRGYILESPLPERLTVYFSDYKMLKDVPRVVIEDETGTSNTSSVVGKVIEVMGGKVVSIEKKAASGLDCEMGGKDEDVLNKIADIFSCQKTSENTEFDLKIKIGKTFAKRF